MVENVFTIPENECNARNSIHILKTKLCTLSLDLKNIQMLHCKWSHKEYSNVNGFQIDRDVYHKITSNIWNSQNGGRLHKDRELQCFSECVLPNGDIVQSHPLFNSEKPWYDWVTVKWNYCTKPLPAKVLLMFKIHSGMIENFNVIGDCVVPCVDLLLDFGKSYAIIQSVSDDKFNYRGKQFHLKSNLATPHSLEPNLRLIELEYNDGCKTVIVLKDRSLWKDLFLEL